MRIKKSRDSSESIRLTSVTPLNLRGPAPGLDSVDLVQPAMKPESRRCFVIMPSGNHGEYEKGTRESEFIFNDIIHPAATEALGENVLIHREADKRVPGAITKEIVTQVALADVVIVDLTGQNPNVFFELGIRYALRSSITVLIKQKNTEVPFDIHLYRCVVYDPLFEGVERSRKEIARAISEAVAQVGGQSDSLVFDIFPDLSVEIPGFLTQASAKIRQSTMPWAEYLESLSRIAQRLEAKVRSGEFSVDLVAGISNGGMMFADLLGMKPFLFERPKVALWANRKEVNFFQNDLNNALLDGVNSMFKQLEAFNVILTDDFIGSGHTIRQALKYVSEKLPKARVMLLPLVCPSNRYIDMFKSNLLWFQEPFSNSEAEVKELHATARIRFPYEKEIQGEKGG
jgi:pyrimidine operon attenuation protein/uracil phosphoribosyltransferase